MTIRAIFFDVGETLVDETRQWGLWADFLGVPRFTFFAVLGGIIQAGRHHREVFSYFDAESTMSRLGTGSARRAAVTNFWSPTSTRMCNPLYTH